MIGTIVSHYKILDQLGGGGMGAVYKAQDLKLDRLVALKFLPPDLTRDPEARQRFIHEAKAASALDHQNICVVHDIGESEDGQLFIVMACYEGETLKKKIERGPLKIDDAVDIAIQIAEGLSKAHKHGIIHRDIKPANIVITTEGVVKIVDFGLAKLSGRTMLTQAGSTLGTAAYMSPEQASGEAVDARTDIWSLGVLLYEMLTGQRPFKAEYENALIYSILNTDPPPPSSLCPDIPVPLEHTVTRCLAKKPEDRYKHIDDLLADLRSAPAGAAEAGASGSSRLTSTVRRKRTKGLHLGLSSFVIAVVAAIAYMVFRSTGTDESPVTHLKMIAVLPFENLGSAEDEYFADGLTEEITSRLSAIHELGVISRTSAIQYKKAQKSLPDIAHELGVEYILD